MHHSGNRRLAVAIASLLLASTAALRTPARVSMSAAAAAMAPHLHEPKVRDTHYSGNVAQHLVDLHDSKGTFNFCGGMMFQLVLSDALRSHLAAVAAAAADGADAMPLIHDADTNRMNKMAAYDRSAAADNVRLFHGREVRKVPDAAGGMGFTIHLSLAGADDPEGWTAEELAGYDGWGHDSQRVWRTGERLEGEGFGTFRSKFGPEAFTLHHRFFLHLDSRDQMWLSAEDGCEGFPAPAGQRNMLRQMLGM